MAVKPYDMTCTPNYETLPAHMQEGARNYVERGWQGGGFLMALFSGDIEYARLKADADNTACFDEWLHFLRWEIPGNCHGTADRVKAWIKQGGMVGKEPAVTNAGKPKIFVFINSGKGTDWVVGSAIAEDGTGLGGHCSSSDNWFRHDMGLESDWKHDGYRTHYPDGYELVEVEDPANHNGLDAACQLNQQKAAQAKEATA